MKLTLSILLSILLGIALGAGAAVLRIRSAPWNPKLDESSETPKTTAATPLPRGPSPKVVVDKANFDFGPIDTLGGASHDFLFTNAGDAPLTLAVGPTSCRCTVSKLGSNRVPPGGSTKVTLSWKPIEKPGPAQQTAKILTNDPARPEVMLNISGRISVTMQFFPPELVFSRLTAGETSTDESQLLYYLTEPMKILGHTWSDAATAQFYDVAMQPLSAEELKKEPLVQSGWHVKVTVKPGLPQGPIRQRLVVQTSLASLPEVSLSIQGMIGGEIAVAGPGWNPDNGVVDLGQVSASTGLHRRLMLVVRGPLRKDVKFKILRVTPDVLKVSLGQPSEVNKGAVMQIPLMIDIPQGSPSTNHLGSEQGKLGEIILESTHPDVATLKIRVRFAIEE